jgi:hypothetical protein
MARYFENAFRADPDVELKTCGWYTRNWIPWMGGMLLPDKYINKPDVIMGGQEMIGREALYPQVENVLGDWKPDMVLTLDAGIRWAVKPKVDCPVVHVATDPHALNYDKPRGYSDFFFNMQKSYSVEGDIYLPYAYDDTWLYPCDLPDGFKYDVSLIGMPYGQRVSLVNRLRGMGLRVAFENGAIFDEYRTILNESIIGLNWSSLDDLNCRVFEIMGVGRIPVINRVTDLPLHFEEGKHYFGFSSEDEAVSQVQHALSLERYRYDGHELVKEKHTFKHRVKQIMETVWK